MSDLLQDEELREEEQEQEELEEQEEQEQEQEEQQQEEQEHEQEEETIEQEEEQEAEVEKEVKKAAAEAEVSPKFWQKTAVKGALKRYYDFEIPTLKRLQHEIYDKVSVWVSIDALSHHRTKRSEKKKETESKEEKKEESRVRAPYVISKKSKSKADEDEDWLPESESSPPATGVRTVAGARKKIKIGPRSYKLKNALSGRKPITPKMVKITPKKVVTPKVMPKKKGRQVQGVFLSETVIHLHEGPDINNTFRCITRRKSVVPTTETSRYECLQCTYAKRGARNKSRKQGAKDDYLAPLNPGPIKKISIMPDGMVIDADEGQHHQDCKPLTEEQMKTYISRKQTQEGFIESGIGRRVQGHIITRTLMYLQDGDRINTFRTHNRKGQGDGNVVSRYECLQCSTAKSGARKKSQTQESAGDEKAPLNVSVKRFSVTADGMVLDADEGEHHEECKPMTEEELHEYIAKREKQEWLEPSPMKKELTEEMKAKERRRKCVSYLNSIHVPPVHISYTMSFIYETLTETPLENVPTDQDIQIIIDNELRKRKRVRPVKRKSAEFDYGDDGQGQDFSTSTPRHIKRPKLQDEEPASPPKPSEIENLENLTDREKIEKCVVCLNSIGAPLQLIGYAVNYIWETLAETRLSSDTSAKTVLEIINNEKKNQNSSTTGLLSEFLLYCSTVVVDDDEDDEDGDEELDNSQDSKAARRRLSKKNYSKFTKRMKDKEKRRKCIMYLNSIGIPLPNIGYAINYIWELLSGTKLGIVVSERTIHNVVEKEKKSQQAARPPPSFYTSTIVVEDEDDIDVNEVVVEDEVDVQTQYYYRHGADGYTTQEYTVHEEQIYD